MAELAKRAWRLIDAVSVPVAIVFLLIGFLVLHGQGNEIHRDEQATRATAAHTRQVQNAGAPVAVCLLDALRAVTPLLERAPTVAEPLAAYVRLQSHRYPGVTCPDRR